MSRSLGDFRKTMFNKKEVPVDKARGFVAGNSENSSLRSVNGLAQFVPDKAENSLSLGTVTEENELVQNVQDQLPKLIEPRSSFGEHILDYMVTLKINNFKSSMRKRLSGMGVDRYEEKGARAGGFIKNIVKDYYKNTKKLLGFGLAVEQGNDKKGKKIILEANDFIESVNLDNVVTKVTVMNKEANREGMDLSEYLEVSEMGAVDAMEELKKMRTKLTPDVSRWFGAVQRIVGRPKEGEPFRNYLQRAMSMKSEVDDNLNNPDQENIENALREIVPMLKDAIFRARHNGKQVGNENSGKNKIEEGINKDSQLGTGDLLLKKVFEVDRKKQFGLESGSNNKDTEGVSEFEGDSEKKEEVESVGDLDQIIAAINNDENTKEAEKIDLSEYLEVVEMNAAKAWGKLKRLSAGFSFDVKKWLGVVQLTIGVPNETESLREYLQKALNKEDEINGKFTNAGQENIKKVLKAIVPVLHKVVLFDRLSK